MAVPDRPSRILILYNTDYDAELTAGAEASVSAVQASAQSISAALVESGFSTEMVGLHGLEVIDLMARLRASLEGRGQKGAAAKGRAGGARKAAAASKTSAARRATARKRRVA